MTEKENYLRVARGEMPEWVPHYSFAASPYRTVPTVKTGCPLVEEHLRSPEERLDIWGVPYVASASAANQKLPKPNAFILADIADWRSVIKAPDLSGFDLELVAKRQLDSLGIDRRETAVTMRMHFGYFQLLVSFMGFEEALVALITEPEECRELIEYLSDFYIGLYSRYIDCLRPDILCITDDEASWSNTFFSLDTYRELFRPYQERQARLALDRGLPIEMHCCGRCEDFIPDWLELGVSIWQTAQTSNDLHAIKEKYGRRLALCGCWHPQGELLEPDCPEDIVRAYARSIIDEYAPGGGFIFYGSFLGAVGDESAARKNRWVADEVASYGRSFYR